MSDSEEENCVIFGVPLEELDEENLPRKKPVTIADQYACDSEGRRRFHGAFTGGFSAGYFNSVGSQEGWRPQQFKSSRGCKKETITQRPEDFMDDEDISEFGIAPRVIRTTKDYADDKSRGVKRERIAQTNDGPIPGVPVLHELLKPMRETVGVTLLKSMGWKPGQGVGSRLSKKQKAKAKRQNEKMKVYGCELQPSSQKQVESASEESDDETAGITFAPDDYEPFRCKAKDNYFGIGYVGLDRKSVLSGHVNLFETPAFSVQDKNRKLSIHGQAFGVGAFEVDDEDIYAREDISRYDFSLGPEQEKKSRWSQNALPSSENGCLDGFVPAKEGLKQKTVAELPSLPKDFVPHHAIRKSRFYPPIECTNTAVNNKPKVLNATDRARIIGDNSSNEIRVHSKQSIPENKILSGIANVTSKQIVLQEKGVTENSKKQQSNTSASWLDKLQEQSFIKGGIVGADNKITGSLKELKDFKDSSADILIEKTITTVIDDSIGEKSLPDKQETVKPLFADPDKQRRFEQFIEFAKAGEKHKLETIQPLSMTDWDRDNERTEFEQAANLQLAERLEKDHDTQKFVHSTESDTVVSPPSETSAGNEMKQAAKMKMFGKLTRVKEIWKPASIVCKRFNIPEPRSGCATEIVTPVKSSIFENFESRNAPTFLKGVDTVSKQLEKPRSLRGTTNAMSNLCSQSSASNVAYINDHQSNASNVTYVNDHQVSEHTSEKMKHFEATYEKVFGKDIQGIPTGTDRSIMSKSQQPTTNVASFAEMSTATSLTDSKDKSEEKKDLFKAIFLSSSEDSESETEETVDSEAMKSILIGKVPQEANVQRNTSPPRGIFAKVDLDNLITQGNSDNEGTNSNISSKRDILLVTDNEQYQSKDVDVPAQSTMPPDMYGPALPTRLVKNESSVETEVSQPQFTKLTCKSVAIPKPRNDETIHGRWVEHHKLKKSKKEKKKHKEHKSSKHKHKSKKKKHK